MKRYAVSVILVALLFMGGAAKQTTVLVDGLPLPTTEYIEKNNTNNIRVEGKITQYKWEKEEDKKKGREWLYPFANLTINSNEVQIIEKETVHVSWTLRVVNPNREYYFLGVEYVTIYPNRERRKIYKIFHEGDVRDKIFHLGKDVEETKPEVRCMVFIYTDEKENDFELNVNYNEQGGEK
ncbi:MAG: hypothetical protein PF495_16445 [Spirochaetales bacterium]|jgi:hypothetical protein|nr:hypothetical protein [Spirochaetales bacterium]